jgi:non-ribosomal peptide synthetase component F
MFACSLSNSCYTIIDTTSPKDRIEKILTTLNPSAIIVDNKNKDKFKELGFDYKILVLEDLLKSKLDNKSIEKVNKELCDTDPLYILFTSGSTGVPKGTVVCHRSVIDYASVICKTFNITSRTKFGSQTPFYFSMSILDIFSTIISGATFNIIPKMYFSFPVKLIEYLNEFKINTVYWVPSALSIVANLKVLDVIKPKYLKKILFAGEVMPTKQLNIWMKKYPKAMYANLYGPTEITDTCTYYIVNRKFKDDES